MNLNQSPMPNPTPEHLRLLDWADRVRRGSLYEDFTLEADVDLGGAEWEPVGTADAPYSGVFDGGGHTISGLYVPLGYFCAGFFGRLVGVVENLNLRGTVHGYGYVGGIAALVQYGEVRGCGFEGEVLQHFSRMQHRSCDNTLHL